MKILFDHTARGVVNRFGLQNHLEQEPYFGRVKTFGPVKIAPAKKYGGLVSLSHGEYSTKPGVFSFAPPETSPLTVTIGNQVMFEGTARRKLVTSDAELFDLYPPDIDKKVTDYHASGELDAVLGAAAVSMGLVYRPVKMRRPSPVVDYTVTGTRQLLQIISDIAGFFTHWLRIENGILYAGDMLADPEQYPDQVRRFKKTRYLTPEPYAYFTADNQSIIGSTAYGRKTYKITPVCSASSAVINQALYNIRTIMEQNRISVKLPLEIPLPVFGQRFDWYDNEIGYHAYVTARALNYDYRSAAVVIEGEGDFTR